ncbi:MAG: hypothetical protein Q4C01_06720, partial [Clostridia bacterium]|nr:hypothetical protein [Clostridia bacterium]
MKIQDAIKRMGCGLQAVVHVMLKRDLYFVPKYFLQSRKNLLPSVAMQLISRERATTPITINAQLPFSCIEVIPTTAPIRQAIQKNNMGNMFCLCVSKSAKSNMPIRINAEKPIIGKTSTAHPEARKHSIRNRRIQELMISFMVWLMRLNSTMSGDTSCVQTNHIDQIATTLHAFPPTKKLTNAQVNAEKRNTSPTQVLNSFFT